NVGQAARPSPTRQAGPSRRLPPPMPARPTASPPAQGAPTAGSEMSKSTEEKRPAASARPTRQAGATAEPGAKMVFAPDDADFMSAITAQPRRKSQSVRQKSSMLIGVMSAVCVAVGIVLWLTLRNHFQGGSAEQAGGPGSATTKDAATTAAVPGKTDATPGVLAGKKGTEPTAHREDAKDATAPAAAGD